MSDPYYAWAAVNVRLLWSQRHLHPVVRNAIRYWLAYRHGVRPPESGAA